MRLVAIKPVDRNIFCRDNFKFYFKKLLVSRGIKVQDDVLTKEQINAKCMRWGSYNFGKISSAVVM